MFYPTHTKPEYSESFSVFQLYLALHNDTIKIVPIFQHWKAKRNSSDPIKQPYICTPKFGRSEPPVSEREGSRVHMPLLKDGYSRVSRVWPRRAKSFTETNQLRRWGIGNHVVGSILISGQRRSVAQRTKRSPSGTICWSETREARARHILSEASFSHISTSGISLLSQHTLISSAKPRPSGRRKITAYWFEAQRRSRHCRTMPNCAQCTTALF